MIHNIDPQLSQWDVGRSVTVSGTNATHIHFANQGDSKAVIIEIENGSAKIPDFLLQTSKSVIAYAVLNGVTLESKSFPVRKREMPESYVYEEDQRNYIYKLITDAESAVVNAKEATKSASTAADSANLATQNANEATNSANIATQNANEATKMANEAATKANNAVKNMMVVGEAEGASIALDDAIDQTLVGLRVFGKTTQDGTPTPDAPVDLVSVGDDGSIEVSLHGGNMAESIYTTNDLEQYNSALYIETTLTPSTTYTLSFRGTTGNAYYTNENVFDQVWVGVQDGTTTVVLTTKSILNKGTNAQYHSGRGWLILKNSKKNSDHVFSSVMLNLGAIAKDYGAPKGKQTFSVSTTNGLPGIPVTSGGNYTDANGQQWICDEIDFACGVYVQRVYKEIFDGSKSVHNYTELGDTTRFYINLDYKTKTTDCISNKLAFEYNYAKDTEHIYVGKEDTFSCLFININRLSSADANGVKSYLSNNPVEVMYALATPIETPLTENELADYASLHTYKDNTTVSNDAGAWMNLEYVMDAKKYIDSLVGGGIATARVE